MIMSTSDRRWLWLACIVITAIIQGCAYTVSIPDNSPLWGGYKLDQKYIIQRDIFLMEDNSLGYFLIPERNFKRRLGRHKLAPNSTKEYKNNPHQASIIKLKSGPIKLNVVGVVTKGTTIKAIELVKRKGRSMFYGNFETLTVYGKILTGPYAGERVNIRDISIYYRKPGNRRILYKPERAIIVPVNESENI